MENEIAEILKHQGFVKDDNQTSELEMHYIKFINPYLWVKVIIHWVPCANFLEIIVKNKVREVDPSGVIKDYIQGLNKIYSHSYVKSVRLNLDIFINRIIQDCVVEFIRSIFQKDISNEGKSY